MRIRIVIDDESAAVAANVHLLMLGAMSYLADANQFPGFREWLVGLARADPCEPIMASWFSDLEPASIHLIATRIAAAWPRDSMPGEHRS